jgi:topoisomerase-4 subunit B
LFNGEKYFSENGLKDLLEETISGRLGIPNYPLEREDIEIALTHSKTQYSEEYHSCKWTKHHTRRNTFSCLSRKQL